MVFPFAIYFLNKKLELVSKKASLYLTFISPLCIFLFILSLCLIVGLLDKFYRRYYITNPYVVEKMCSFKFPAYKIKSYNEATFSTHFP